MLKPVKCSTGASNRIRVITKSRSCFAKPADWHCENKLELVPCLITADQLALIPPPTLLDLSIFNERRSFLAAVATRGIKTATIKPESDSQQVARGLEEIAVIDHERRANLFRKMPAVGNAGVLADAGNSVSDQYFAKITVRRW